jgi:hypothetical protein
MILTVEFVHRLNTISKKQEIFGRFNIETEDLNDAVERARIVLSSKDFNPAVEGFRILVNGDQLVYREQRGDSDILEPVTPRERANVIGAKDQRTTSEPAGVRTRSDRPKI